MNAIVLRKIVTLLCGTLALSAPAYAQIELTGSYEPLMYEDYIERGPGSRAPYLSSQTREIAGEP